MVTMEKSNVLNSVEYKKQGVGEVDKKLSAQKHEYHYVKLDITNSVLPVHKLVSDQTPSRIDGMDVDTEAQLRRLGCDYIQIAGRLLKLPQVAMATSCVLFQRYYYAKSFVRVQFDVLAMAALVLACKIEECLKRTRDIVNVFTHIKQVRSGRPITPVLLDSNYISLKSQIINAERRLLKELGFCVHVKHPHKIIVMYLKWLNLDTNRQLIQMSWNFMNDAHQTDVFVRYPPELIAAACIYLSARKLSIVLPNHPHSWLQVLGYDQKTDIHDCCTRIIALYNFAKPNQQELEAKVLTLRKKVDEMRKLKLANGGVLPTSVGCSSSNSGKKSDGALLPNGTISNEQKPPNVSTTAMNGVNESKSEISQKLSPKSEKSSSKTDSNHRSKHRRRSRSRSNSPSNNRRHHHKRRTHRRSARREDGGRSSDKSPSLRDERKSRHRHRRTANGGDSTIVMSDKKEVSSLVSVAATNHSRSNRSRSRSPIMSSKSSSSKSQHLNSSRSTNGGSSIVSRKENIVLDARQMINASKILKTTSNSSNSSNSKSIYRERYSAAAATTTSSYR